MRRYASMWSWPILAIVGAARLGMGHYELGTTVLVFALLAWGLSRSAGDDSSSETD